jgi:hypothetical protein
VNRTRRRQGVFHAQRDGFALAPAQQRCRQAAVDHGRETRSAGKVHWQRSDIEVELVAGKFRDAWAHRLCKQRPQQAE